MSATASPGSVFKMVQVSDVHFGGEHPQAVEAAVECIQAARPDLVIGAGDLTKDGAQVEFDAARAWFARLPQPQLLAPGNHDTPFKGPVEILERLATPWRRYEARFGDADGLSFRDERAAVFTLNSARGAQIRWNWSKGAVSRAQTRAVTRRLQAEPPGRLKVVVCHHPLIEMMGGPMTAKVRGGEAAALAFAEAGADLVLTGHIHAPFVHAYPYAGGCTQAVGSGTLSVRERGVPPSFNIIEADATEMRITAMAFERTGFVVWRTWAVNRRPNCKVA
ncbi:metallophosphoesterase [Caulobacter sp. D4A]|uniref:metallophosphoesterase family protein n=1 Tax=unclassified Caulobacter TaxID=2648921 RepID=UPI0026AD4743